MPNQRVTDRPLAAGISLSDLFHIVDTGDLSQNPAGSSYKATINQLKTAISGPFGIPNANGVYTYYPKLRDAVNAASDGQTVEVFADYTETDTSSFGIVTLKNNVDINFNGHTYTYNDGGVVNTAPFIDNSSPVNCALLNGTIKRIGSVSGTGVSACLRILGTSTITTNCTFISNNHSLLLSNSGATMNGGKFYSTGQPRGVVVLEGSTLNNAYVELSFSSVISLTSFAVVCQFSTATTINNCTIYSFTPRLAIADFGGCKIMNTYVNSEGQAISTSNGSVISNCTIENSVSANNSVVFINTNSLITNTSFNIKSITSTLQVSTNSIVKNCSIITQGVGIAITSTNAKIINTTIISNNDAISIIDKGTQIYNCVAISNGVSNSNALLFASFSNPTTTPAVITNSIFTSFSGSTIRNQSNCVMQISNCVIECKWPNPGYWTIDDISSSSGNTYVNNHIISANGLLFRGGPPSKLANNIYQNGNSASIVNLITTTQDNKGNIRYL